MLLLLACTRPAPDAPEPCAEQSWYRDADHDGWGLDADVVTACVPPDGYISVSGDCDDGAVDVNPGATESCTLGDDDCDGVADPDGSPGCTDDWTDADGDGYGEGDAVCSCTPSGVAQGGDCDDGDADRILDCTEGAIVPLAGDRLLDDDPEENWWLLAAGDAAGDGQPDILLAGRAGLVAASLPSGDTLLSAATVAEVGGLDIEDVATLDLDGDGGLDVLTGSWTTEVLAAGEGGDYDWLAIDGTVQAFGADFTPLWSRALPTVEGEGGYTTLFGADFDGDGFDEPYAGLTAAYVGTTALWRVDDPVTTIATADDGSLGEFFPVGDLDGDGVDELAVDAVIYDVLDEIGRAHV